MKARLAKKVVANPDVYGWDKVFAAASRVQARLRRGSGGHEPWREDCSCWHCVRSGWAEAAVMSKLKHPGRYSWRGLKRYGRLRKAAFKRGEVWL